MSDNQRLWAIADGIVSAESRQDRKWRPSEELELAQGIIRLRDYLATANKSRDDWCDLYNKTKADLAAANARLVDMRKAFKSKCTEEENKLRARLVEASKRMREARLAHDWLEISNLECEIDAAKAGGEKE